MGLFKVSFTDSSTFTVTPFVPFMPSMDAVSTPCTLEVFLHSALVISNVMEVTLCPFTTTVSTDPVPIFPRMNSVVARPSFEVPFSSTSSVVTFTAQSFALPTKLECSDFAEVITSDPDSFSEFANSADNIFPVDPDIPLWVTTVICVLAFFVGLLD